jgi:rhodanese-related sulfurtransferase
MTTRPPGASSIEDILAQARARLRRVEPLDAHKKAQANEAVIVDIRPAAMRADEGEVPGSIIIERNHLEWRLDPESGARLPWVENYDHQVIVICQEGYTSSLAAAALHDLGLTRATDVIGGFHAWLAAGLPSADAAEHTVTLAPGAASASR